MKYQSAHARKEATPIRVEITSLQTGRVEIEHWTLARYEAWKSTFAVEYHSTFFRDHKPVEDYRVNGYMYWFSRR